MGLETLNEDLITIDTIIRPSDLNLRRAIFEVHKGTCYYSKSIIDIGLFHIEHIKPKSKGGLDCIRNYLPSEKGINMMKMANYESHYTESLISINSLVYAPRVLKRYIELKKVGGKNKKDEKMKRGKDVEGTSYHGIDFIDSLVDKYKSGYSNYIIKLVEKNEYFNRFTIECQLPLNFVDKDVDNGRIVFNREGNLIDLNSEEKTNGNACLTSKIVIDEKKETLKLYVNIPTGIDEYNKGTEAVKYFSQLINKMLLCN